MNINHSDKTLTEKKLSQGQDDSQKSHAQPKLIPQGSNQPVHRLLEVPSGQNMNQIKTKATLISPMIKSIFGQGLKSKGFEQLLNISKSKDKSLSQQEPLKTIKNEPKPIAFPVLTKDFSFKEPRKSPFMQN